MASRMRVTSLMNEGKCYQALPVTAKTIGHQTPGHCRARTRFLHSGQELCQNAEWMRRIAERWSERRDSNPQRKSRKPHSRNAFRMSLKRTIHKYAHRFQSRFA